MTSGSNPHLLQSIAGISGGTYHESLDSMLKTDLFVHDNIVRKTYHEIWKTLMYMAMAILLMEIAIRRLVLPRLRPATGGASGSGAGAPLVERLLMRKQMRRKEEKTLGGTPGLDRITPRSERPVWKAPFYNEREPRLRKEAPPEKPQEEPRQSEDTFSRLLRFKKQRKKKK